VLCYPFNKLCSCFNFLTSIVDYTRIGTQETIQYYHYGAQAGLELENAAITNVLHHALFIFLGTTFSNFCFLKNPYTKLHSISAKTSVRLEISFGYEKCEVS
jgi:hypothetical protein